MVTKREDEVLACEVTAGGLVPITPQECPKLRKSLEECSVGDFVHGYAVPKELGEYGIIKVPLKSENIPHYAVDATPAAVDAAFKVAIFEKRITRDGERFFFRVS